MNITPLKTHPITAGQQSLEQILDQHLPSLSEGSILAVTSKIISLCQGRVVPVAEIDKQSLVTKHADYYLPPESNNYGVTLTITDNILIPSAGIDESNANGSYILWPEAVQKVANQTRIYLKKRFNLKQVGVLITDSKTTPLRWGTTGISLAHSGFAALKDYIGQPDIFDRPMHMTKANLADALAAAAVLVMGEGNEQTPLAVIETVPFIDFQNRPPTKVELAALRIDMADDIYAPLLTAVEWRKGQSKP